MLPITGRNDSKLRNSFLPDIRDETRNRYDVILKSLPNKVSRSPSEFRSFTPSIRYPCRSVVRFGPTMQWRITLRDFRDATWVTAQVLRTIRSAASPGPTTQ